jgi:hypothetical protein
VITVNLIIQLMLSVLQRTDHSIKTSYEKNMFIVIIFAKILVIVITFQIKTADYGDFQLKKCYTVKPVYNGHPWDLKKVAVKQRVM